MKIKELDSKQNIGGVHFKHPETGEECIWTSQWGYPDGKAGVWYKKPKDKNPNQIYPIHLDTLEEALEWEVIN